MPYVAPRILGPSRYYEGEDIVTMWRPRGWDGTLIIDTLVTNWDLNVYPEKVSGAQLTPIYTLSAQSTAGIMFSSLQQDGWDEDDDGYTFAHTLDVSAAMLTLDGGKRYRLEYRLNTADYGPILGVHLVDLETTRSA